MYMAQNRRYTVILMKGGEANEPESSGETV